MNEELTGRQWTTLLSLLSLDGLLPLYEPMGVPVDDKKAFQKALRATILRVRASLAENPASEATVQDELLKEMSPARADEFRHWASGVFLGVHAKQPLWSAWDIVFSQWAYSRRIELGFLPPEKAEAFVEGYKQTASTEDIRDRSDQLLGEPLSDWDLEMYVRHSYGASWEDGPWSTAEWIIRIERLKRFAKTIWAHLNNQERTELQREAQRLLDELHVWMPGPLSSIGSLLGQA